MLEAVLMTAFLKLYVSCKYTSAPTHSRLRCAERQAFTTLSSVCSCWHLTLTGWPQSPTSQWVRHKLKKQI